MRRPAGAPVRWNIAPTIDHTWQRGDMRHVLKRAVGLDTHLVVDYTDGELMPGDVFVMATDGVCEVLGERVVREVLDAGSDVQTIDRVFSLICAADAGP